MSAPVQTTGMLPYFDHKRKRSYEGIVQLFFFVNHLLHGAIKMKPENAKETQKGWKSIAEVYLKNASPYTKHMTFFVKE